MLNFFAAILSFYSFEPPVRLVFARYIGSIFGFFGLAPDGC